MSRITHKNCERLCDAINEMTGSPKESYLKDASGRLRAQIGNYHLYRCLGVCSLVRMVSDGGSIRTIIHASTAPELFERMHAWAAGWRDSADAYSRAVQDAAKESTP
jgi:hypothetical protein